MNITDNNRAFSAGVARGGLTDDNQIRILICYLAARRQKKLAAADVIEVLTAEGLANYFECASAVSDMLDKKNLVADSDALLDVSDDGRYIADVLAEDVPLSVREHALSACDGLIEHKTNIGQHKVEITRLENGYNVRCSISDLGTPVFVLELYAPNSATAEKIKQRFVESGAKIYETALSALTE